MGNRVFLRGNCKASIWKKFRTLFYFLKFLEYFCSIIVTVIMIESPFGVTKSIKIAIVVVKRTSPYT